MKIRAAKRIEALPEYAFKLVDDRVAELKAKGIEPIDFGVGDPSTPTPVQVREACQRAIDARKSSGYPSYIGDILFRKSIADWTKRRFNVDIDPATEVSSTLGSKEGIFNFHEAFVDPGDLVLVPTPGYPPYTRGTLFAEGIPFFYPLLEENGFLPDLDSIPDEVASRAKIIWVNYPNSPTGVCPGLDFFKELYSWTTRHNIIMASDEAYSEFYFGNTPPPTALQAGQSGVIVFNSLSKRSAMTGYRVGWAMGDPEIIAVFRKMKTNIDSGTPTFIQDAAIAALEDENHVTAMREEYRIKREILTDGLARAGLTPAIPEGTLYIWQKVPEGMTSFSFTEALTAKEIAIVCTPGSLLAEQTTEGLNPGEGYVRFALTPSVQDVEEARNRLASLQF